MDFLKDGAMIAPEILILEVISMSMRHPKYDEDGQLYFVGPELDEEGKLVPKSRTIVTDCTGDEILTTQADAKEVDINNIMKRIEKTGMLPTLSNGQPFYGDVSEFGGLQEAIMKVQEADELFMSLPAQVRERFDNDPVRMIEFLEDGSNYEEALKMGLVRPRPEPAPAPAPSPAPGA